MAALSMETTIKAIMVLIVIVVVLGGTYYLYNTYILPLAKPDFESLPSDQKNIIELEFNNFIAKANECRKQPTPITDKCICKDVLPKFPLNLAKDLKLNITQGGDAEIVLLFDDKLIFKGTVNQAQISSIDITESIPKAQTISLEKNMHLVGGIFDFDKRVFTAEYYFEKPDYKKSNEILTNHLVRLKDYPSSLSLTEDFVRLKEDMQISAFEGLSPC